MQKNAGTDAAEERRHPSQAALAYAAGARTLTRALSDVYADSVQARRAFRHAADRDGPAVAADAVLGVPERFGAVRAGLDGAGLRRVVDALHVLAALRESRPRQTLRRVAAHLRSAAAASAHASAESKASQRVYDAERAVRSAQEQREYAKGRLEAAGNGLREVYADPTRVAWVLWVHLRRHGPEATTQALREDPEQFGALRAEERARLLGLVRERDVSAALARVPELAAAVRTAGEEVRRRFRAGDRLRLARAVREAADELAALGDGPSLSGEEQLRRAAHLLAGVQWCSVNNAEERKRVQAALGAMLPADFAWKVEQAVKRAASVEPRSGGGYEAQHRPKRERDPDRGGR